MNSYSEKHIKREYWHIIAHKKKTWDINNSNLLVNILADKCSLPAGVGKIIQLYTRDLNQEDIMDLFRSIEANTLCRYRIEYLLTRQNLTSRFMLSVHSDHVLFRYTWSDDLSHIIFKNDRVSLQPWVKTQFLDDRTTN